MLRKIGYFILISFLIALIMTTGCISSSNQKSTDSNSNKIGDSTTKSNLDEKIDLATKIVPENVQCFRGISKGKDPMSGTLQGDEYTESGYYEPAQGSQYEGKIDMLAIDVMVYSDAYEAQKWYDGVWKKLSDGPITVNEIQGVYRYDSGEASIAFIDNNLIIVCDSLYNQQPPDYYHEENITKEAVIAGAEETIKNLKEYS